MSLTCAFDQQGKSTNKILSGAVSWLFWLAHFGFVGCTRALNHLGGKKGETKVLNWVNYED